MDPEQLFSSVKKDVRSLLLSSKHGLSPETLRKDYQDMLGHPIPLKDLGFHSVLDMIKEMPDVVHLDYALDGTIVLKVVEDEKTIGMKVLISKQRNNISKTKSKSSKNVGLFSPQSRYHQRSPALPRRSHVPPVLSAGLRSQLKQLLTHGPIGLSELETRYALRFGRPLCVTHHGFYSIAEMLAAASDMITVRQTRFGSQLVLKTQVTLVKQRLNSAAVLPIQSTGTSKVSTSSVLQEEAVFSHHQLESQQKPKDAAAISVQETEPNTLLMQEKSFEKSVAKLEEEFRKRIFESRDAGTVSQDLKEKLQKVVAGHHQGIVIQNLPLAFKKMYGEELPLTQCGFMSVTEMVEALSETFCVLPSTEEGAKHLLVMVPKPNNQPGLSSNLLTEEHYFIGNESAWECQHDGVESMESLESDAEIEIAHKVIHQTVDNFPLKLVSHGPLVPLDALQCQKLKSPTCRRERELVPVVVERIESPSQFYVRFYEDQEARAFENMMFEMRNCYSSPNVAGRYRLADAYVRPGQVCCVAPTDMWFYRVVIHQRISATEVEVYFVDFGDFIVVSRCKLRFLKSCYAQLPAQTVPSVLAGVKPVQGVWSKEATSLFQKLCYDRTLVAAVHSYQNDFLLLFLCDTHTPEDLYIHSILKAEGHAVACTVASTPMLQQFSPVTLYLGDGQLEEVTEDFAAVNSSLNATNEENLTQQLKSDAPPLCSQFLTDVVDYQEHNQEIALLDLPELELIDETQNENSNLFEALLNKDSASFGNWDQGWMDKVSVDEESKHLRDVQEKNAKIAARSPVQPVQSIKPMAETQPMLESQHTQKPPSTLHTLIDQTPVLNHKCNHHTDWSPFHLLPSSLMYSLFSSGDRLAQDAQFLRHTSPLALSPSARMVAGPSLHSGYTHKQV